MSKLTQVYGFTEMVSRLKLMYECFMHHDLLTRRERALLAAALLYFISPLDLIPDYLLPYGYIDDAVVVGFVFHKLNSVLMRFKGHASRQV